MGKVKKRKECDKTGRAHSLDIAEGGVSQDKKMQLSEGDSLPKDYIERHK